MIEPASPAGLPEVARHYDQLDRFYREIWGDHVHHGYWRTGRESPEEAAREMVGLIADAAEIRRGMRVLDAGCGYGATAMMLAALYGAVVTGLTISPAQYRHAQAAAAPGGNPEFLLEDWGRNRRASRSFDAVIAVESTEHMQDKPAVFREIARVLKPGGRLAVCAWLAGDALKPWQRRHLIEAVCREGRLAGMGTEADYCAWITAAGMNVDRVLDISRNVQRTWPVCAWRMIKGIVRNPAYLRFLAGRENDNRIFALTVFRIWLAYRCGAMRYAVFSAELPREW